MIKQFLFLFRMLGICCCAKPIKGHAHNQFEVKKKKDKAKQNNIFQKYKIK